MEEVKFESVLEFLRKNGLSVSESALMEDVRDKSHLGSSDFEKFLFPMEPPPRPLRIPSSRRLPFGGDGGGGSAEGSSDDEFVSLGSSTTELCSSEFTNPYGIRTTRPTSQASSDRLSQFGTARDYPDFDMQNDLFWYKEKDEDYAMPPLFGDGDFDGDPSEDKYIMTVQTGEHAEDRFGYNIESGKGAWDLNSRVYFKNEAKRDYYELGELFQLERSEEKFEEHGNDYSCLVPLCASCSRLQRAYAGSPTDYGLGNLSTADARESQLQSPEENHEADSQSNGNEDFEYIQDDVSRELQAAVEEEDGGPSDELLMCGDKEDDYEIFNLRIIHRKNRTGFEENKEIPIVLNNIIAGRYYVTEYLGSAAFSKVIQAHDLYSGMDVCLKIIKNDKDFFDQSLDEIKLLKFVNRHDPADEHHILRLYDYFYHQEHLFIVTELLRANLYEFQKYNRESGGDPYFTLNHLQVITRQCLEAVSYLHDLGIIHCDLKPENILIKSYRRCEIKVIDLGSSCFQTDNLSLYVQSRSYRAPEVMLGLPYDQKIDLWSVGCILAELCTGEVLFPNEGVVMLLARMIGLLGPIDMSMLKKGQETHKYFTEEYDLYYLNEETNQVEYIFPLESSLEDRLQISDPGLIDFLKFLLQINPKTRPTAREALQHPWLSHTYEVNSFGVQLIS
ncbi:uncharacterized protein [Henckelia pumila]|uniref:uncharacterized protein isoform X2 n=1 Tax=Henckelia pumila TaxID=405737 RepID=UPI003C6E6DF1